MAEPVERRAGTVGRRMTDEALHLIDELQRLAGELRAERERAGKTRVGAEWVRWLMPMLIAAVVGYFSAQSAMTERMGVLEQRTLAVEAQRAELKGEIRDLSHKVDRLLEIVIQLRPRPAGAER